MAKSLAQLIKLFESVDESVDKKSITEDSLVSELREAQELFNSYLEEQGDPYHIGLKVKIAELKYQISKQNTQVLTEQSRSLSTRKTQKVLKEESITDMWQLPFYSEDDRVVDKRGITVCECGTTQKANIIATLLNNATEKEYQQQLMTRVKKDTKSRDDDNWIRYKK